MENESDFAQKLAQMDALVSGSAPIPSEIEAVIATPAAQDEVPSFEQIMAEAAKVGRRFAREGIVGRFAPAPKVVRAQDGRESKGLRRLGAPQSCALHRAHDPPILVDLLERVHEAEPGVEEPGRPTATVARCTTRRPFMSFRRRSERSMRISSRKR